MIPDYKEKVGENDLGHALQIWAGNLGGFVLGSLNAVQEVAANTSKIAVDAVFLPVVAIQAVSEASIGVCQALLNKNSQSNSEQKLQILDEKPTTSEENVVIKIACDVSHILLGAISPLLPQHFLGAKKVVARHPEDYNKFAMICDEDSPTNSKTESDSFSSNEFFDVADFSEGSIYYDSNYDDNLQNGGSEADEKIPSSITVEEFQMYYLDISQFQDNDQLVADHSIQHDSMGQFLGVNSNTNPECYTCVLEKLVATAKRIEEESSTKAEKWKPDENTKRLLHSSIDDKYSEEMVAMLECNVLKWFGSFCYGDSKAEMSALKTRGIVNFAPRDLLELLLDCKRVHEFNKNSLGKKVVCVLDGNTRIVENALKIPIVGSAINTLALTHYRCLNGNLGQDDSGFILLSKSVKKSPHEPDSHNFLSISILRCVPHYPEKTDLTNIAQTSSLPIPKFLMNQVAVMGATDFFSNLRKIGRVGKSHL